MKNSVTVATHPVTGNVVTEAKNNKDFETIRVEQTGIRFSAGFANIENRSAVITAKKGTFSSFQAGMELPGQIVAKETFHPQYEGHTAKINPTSKEDVLVNGKKVYLKYEYTEDMIIKDVLLRSIAIPVVLQKETL
jgi:hypothetical protein